MVEWEDVWFNRLRKFVHRQRQGKCQAIKMRRMHKTNSVQKKINDDDNEDNGDDMNVNDV
jgi:hypothetical protein